MQLNHFPIISQWELSVAMATKPTADHHNFNYFELPLPSCHLKKSLFKIECFLGNQTKWPPVIKHINWVDN